MKIAILGAGLVGGPMAIDLSKDKKFKVTSVDINGAALRKLNKEHPDIEVLEKDLSMPDNVTKIVSGFDMVINAVPGFIGFQTLKAIIKEKKNVVDIAFFPEDPFELDELAKENGVTAIVDCGVAPGMSNILIGHVDSILDETQNVITYVGGLPELRQWPYEYKAVFSPIDVIEEYTRPARYVDNDKMVVRPALSDSELLDFPGIGTLEAFNSDGLRTIAKTINAPNMKEKTLRYIGHIEKIAVLRETGFFDKEEIEINGIKIRPIDFTTKLLLPKWQMKEDEVDITVMKVIVEGKVDGVCKRYTYDLFDKFDPETKVHSMARTTGYTATVVLRMLADGMYKQTGISPPEYLGKHQACVEYILSGLKERKIYYQETVEILDS